LEENISFLEGRLLNAFEESIRLPISRIFPQTYMALCKSDEHGLRFGEHGLPLIGSGDWMTGWIK
jgi:hypothetical protein